MRILLTLLFPTLALCDTTISIIEIGKSGVVRRTTASSPQASPAGVSSFWNKLHDIDPSHRRMTQHPGMAVVPDLFRKPQGGIVIGLKGSAVDLDSLPNVARHLEAGVGRFEVSGSEEQVMEKASRDEIVDDAKEFSAVLGTKVRALKAGGNKLESVSLRVNSDDAARAVDAELAKTLESVRSLAEEMDGTIVVHLVVEEEEGAMRRRTMARQLSGSQDEDEDEGPGEEGGEQADADEGYQAAYQVQNNFYGYGYYNDYGEWVTNYKTIFQIQYFNIVLWTALGLTVVLGATMHMMMYMPMMSDTLLFGESAKMMGS